MPWRYAREAEERVDKILLDGVPRWGIEGAVRYNRLFIATMDAVADQPEFLGSKAVRRVPGIRSIHLRFARRLVPKEHRVRNPSHLVVYRMAPSDGVVECLALVHEHMRLAAAARGAQRAADR